MVEEGADPNPVDRHQRTPLEVRRFAHAALPLKHAWPVHILKPVFACSLQEAARNDHTEVVKVLLSKDARICEDGQLLELEKSKLHGVCNMRRHMLTELGWDPEWEVNPKEVKLIEKIGEGGESWSCCHAVWNPHFFTSVAAGSGEFGDVYRAKWHGSFVAAKILKRSDEIALGDFRTEVRVAQWAAGL